MDLRNSIIISVLLLAIYLQESESIKCFECMGCNDPFNSVNVTQQKNCQQCTKAKLNGAVTRSCLMVKIMDNQCKTQEDNAACWCDEVLCNAAANLKLPLTLFISTAIELGNRILFTML